MRKKSASAPEIPKAAAKPERSRAAKAAATPETRQADKPRAKSSMRKTLVDDAVGTVKKNLKSRTRTTAKTAPQPAVTPAISTVSAPIKPASSPKPVPAEKVKVDAETVVRRPSNKKKPEVPAILLEGDETTISPVSGPGEKFSVGATPPVQKLNGGELPESYGTKKLFLTARDPHWLYANWDLTTDQQKEYNAESTDGHLILRVYAGKMEGHPTYEIHVHPESRHWFAHVERAGHSYTAELGFYSGLGKWMRVAVSSSTLTPPDAAATEEEAEFATIPFEYPFAKLVQIIEEAVRDNLPLAVAIEELRRHGHPDLPRFSSTGVSSVAPAPSSKPGPARVWTPEQEQALARIINIDKTRRVWMGSLEITELIRRRLAHEITSPVTAFGAPPAAAPGGSVEGPAPIPGISSPLGGMPQEAAKNFWFNVNAELIIYGATEPNAKVTLGGHEIKLRADGTFSFRFALPDGKYDLPAIAISPDGTDSRVAELTFSRQTQYLGQVGATPQDPSLQPPIADNI